ncbi:FAD-dependent oxidoreductase [uncultured Roseovarius sp.]|uniref:oxidoreductase n=1 Tax=uncultured Roseovarius sp. TaxID=293344 RepID=UPI00259488D2|nr:FAD-dependent oxidoreductase [uncultured Roseovarius sp.]
MQQTGTPSTRILTQPLVLRGKTLRNRVVFGAHTANMSENGLPGTQHLHYYLERARGGAGMIVVEPQPVHDTAVLTRGNFRPDDDAVIPGFRRITEACKAEGAVMVQQLYHVGQHGDADLSYRPNWSPSGMPSYHDSDGSHALRASEIEDLIQGYIRAAERCRKAGFDGVEVWAAYHSLIEQFWRPWSNRRTDEWGGSLENRMRFGRRIVEGIRQACGEDFIIGLSASHAEKDPVALSLDDMTEILCGYDATGHVDYISCGSGSYIDYDRVMPTFVHGEKLSADLTRRLKAQVSHAVVIAESQIRTPDNAESMLRAQEADLVSVVRGQIADPFWGRKVTENRDDDIRGCISCNQMCWGRRSRDYWISCLVNPSAGREHDWGSEGSIAPADTPRKLLVIGAGPAGLEAARVAAARGHSVTICEAGAQIGGQFRLAGEQPRRGQVLELLDWYERQFDALGVDLRLNTFVDAEDVAGYGADEVIVATGSLPPETGFQRWLPERDRLDGIEAGNVCSVEDIMRRAVVPGKRVVLLDEGGHWRGSGTAWFLAERGHEVSIVTPDAHIAAELGRTTSDVPLRQTLARAGVRFHTESVIDKWTGQQAAVLSMLTGETTMIDADTLVLATTNTAFDMLAQDLDAAGIACHQIGDCVAPRLAPYAFYEGRKLALHL